MTLEGHRREILVLARTGYVVLRIEPAPLACLAPLRVATGGRLRKRKIKHAKPVAEAVAA
ncbi:TPA: hypothetical protein MG690_27080 [Klebsiella pneumoniae]|nr:hypothetical protein [Vibrio cholerae]HBW8870924.1 hypothetical protein [Klebsiella pneumoniae]EGR0491782.1 hypothetical protein [Vibrio cholerae]HBW8871140.1 hypothetical protein [Klebsiella pneumoniae]HBW8898418.1 hypothetical protein [Klebsiella pneumoniae]